MHYDKSAESAVSNVGRHAHRLIQNDRNKDIDIGRSRTSNLCITPYIKEVNGKICDVTKTAIKDGDIVKSITRDNYFDNRALIQKLEYQHYKNRKDELYCYNRKDVNTLVNIAVTLPRELTTKEDIDKFFDCTVSFLSDRYGSENLVSAVRHFDERQIGREHLHYSFIPACVINKQKLLSKKNHVKAMEHYDEKISANDVLTKYDMRTVHKDFQRYLDSVGLKCQVVTKPEGSGKPINLSIEQLKEITDKTGITIDKPMAIDEFINIVTFNRDIKIVDSKLKSKVITLEKENKELQDKIKSLEKQLEQQHSHTWQRPQREFGQNRGWNSTRDQEVKY